MVSKINSYGVTGVGGYKVSVEVDKANGLPAFDIVGLPDVAVKEAKERVKSAVKNSGFDFNACRLTVNLAPADRKKAGTHFDLPILVGFLVSSNVIKKPVSDFAFIGELSLTGELRPVSGILPMAIAAARDGVKKLFVPEQNASEASFADNISIIPVKNVRDLVSYLNASLIIQPQEKPMLDTINNTFSDFSDVKGQSEAKRAFEIAAAGGHNILLIGPPGSGKSMMAKCLPGILPEMSKEEIIESTEIYSVAGMTGGTNPVIFSRPFRSPHHTVSSVAISGGGSIPRPGEVSLAHNGVLFLDELPEFKNETLEVLRQPIEDGEVTVSRVSGTVTFPSRFMLVCAMNPCKCGWYGHPSGRCKCSNNDVRKYQSRISGPLLDRIDIIVHVRELNFDELKDIAPSEPSSDIKLRVDSARRIQLSRFIGSSVNNNAGMKTHDIRKFCRLSSQCEDLMHMAFDSLNLSARSYDRILRVARTIADLNASDDIMPEHLAEAIHFRSASILDEQ